jgi:hypothetical protein
MLDDQAAQLLKVTGFHVTILALWQLAAWALFEAVTSCGK